MISLLVLCIGYMSYLHGNILLIILGHRKGTDRCISTIMHIFHACNVLWFDTYQIDKSNKSHNASDKYPTMHHFVTEMCTCAHFCYKIVHRGIWDCCIVGFPQQVYSPILLWVSFTCTGVIIWIVQCHWTNSEEHGQIYHANPPRTDYMTTKKIQ